MFTVIILTKIFIVCALLSSLLPFVFRRGSNITRYGSSILLGISGSMAACAGVFTLISQKIFSYQITSILPNNFYTWRLDALSGFFLTVVGIIVLVVSIYAPGYLRSYAKHAAINKMYFFTGIFVFGMYLVLLASDFFSFMFAWEIMSFSSYFLVAYHDNCASNRHAAFVYLLMSQLSGFLIACGYGVFIKFGSGFDFLLMHATALPTMWMTIAFCLAFCGFGLKAGLVPLHVWLPKAHPVAPAHISALMSGVMLKVAVYGFLRFVFYLLGGVEWQWGVLVLIIGIISALMGVLYALMQHDLKKLLAYHSVENIGIIFIGIGLALIFKSANFPVLSALALIAALYHCLNHAIFKSLLFLGAGSIIEKAHEDDLERMGGLFKLMPMTAICFLIGCISIAALPPFNGFVSEWLTFQAAIQAVVLKGGVLRTLIPVVAAVLALTGALAAACFVKVYGVAFLGQSRSIHIRDACDPAFGMQLALWILAGLCLLFGIFPFLVLKYLNVIAIDLVGAGVGNFSNWLWLVPLAPQVSSYSAPLILSGVIVTVGICYWLLCVYGRCKTKIVKPWDCGFGGINARMQYSATAFAMPIRRVFNSAWKVSEEIDDTKKDVFYSLHVDDWVWLYGYMPLVKVISFLARILAKIQGGNVRIYLACMFFSLLFLLWIIM